MTADVCKIPANETVRVCKAQVSVPNINNGATKETSCMHLIKQA